MKKLFKAKFKEGGEPWCNAFLNSIQKNKESITVTLRPTDHVFNNIFQIKKQAKMDRKTFLQLRIGSWVETHCVPAGGSAFMQVKSINGNGKVKVTELLTGKTYKYTEDDIFPVTIREKHLLACGFVGIEKKSGVGNDKFMVYNSGDFYFNTSHNKWWYNETLIKNQPLYIHQLQNLFLSLADTEIFFDVHQTQCV